MALILAATACGVSADRTTARATESESVIPSNPVRLVNDFETQKDLNSMMMYTVLGKVTVQSDESYISHGEASAKITVMADPFDGGYDAYTPSLYQSMNIKKDGRDYRDFSKTGTVEFDLYNSSDTQQRIGLALYYSYYNGSSAREWFTLAPNAWTTVRYSVTRELIPESKNGEGNTVRNVEGVYLYFDRQQEETNFYLDALRLYSNDSPIGESVKGELKENEICSFDSLWQITGTAMSTGNARPTLSQSKAFTSDGGSSLKVQTTATAAGGYYYFYLRKANLYKFANFSKLSDDDYFCFELYSPTDGGFEGAIHMYIYTAGQSAYISETVFNVTAGNLSKVRIPLSEINSAPNADPENDACFQYLIDITFGYRTSNSSQTFYIDNVRVEKAAN